MMTRQFPLHRFFHTYIGASLIAVATIALFVFARWFARRGWVPNRFKWRELGLWTVVLGAVAGSFTHVLLDSFMHYDITPFAPFSAGNPLWQAISLEALHWSCLLAGIVGLIVLGMRDLRHREKSR